MHTRTARRWSVQEAKSKLSEVLRRARDEGPQMIGEVRPCVVVSLEAWEARQSELPPLGRWLVEHTPRGETLELPDRSEADRPTGLE